MRFAGSQGFGLAEFTGQNPISFGAVSDKLLQGRHLERLAGIESLSKVGQHGLAALASVASAEAGAASTVAQGAAAGNAAIVGGLFDGIGSLASGAIKGRGGGPTYPGQTEDGYPLGRGSDGSYGGFGGKYGSFQPGSYTDYNPAPW